MLGIDVGGTNIRACLWHGSPHRALRTLDELTWDIGTESPRASALQENLRGDFERWYPELRTSTEPVSLPRSTLNGPLS
jgi:hypothetical protein